MECISFDIFENSLTGQGALFKGKSVANNNNSALIHQACILNAEGEDIFTNIDTAPGHGSCTMVQNHNACWCDKLL